MQGEPKRGDFLKDFSLVLTPNLRSARLLDTLRLQATHPSGQETRVLPWRAWIGTLWQQFILAGLEDRVLLNEAQAAVVWEQVLQQVGPATLRPVRSLVDLCVGAHRLVWQHDAVAKVCEEPGGMETDTEVFATWFRAFEQRCEDDRLIAPAALELEAAKNLRRGDLPAMPGERCLLYGFDRFTPAQEALLGALQSAGTAVTRMDAEYLKLHPDSASTTTAPALLRCDSPEDELRQLAQTLRDLLQSGTRSVSVVLPNVGEMRGKLERELRETLLAGVQEPLKWERAPLWEFSEGIALSSVSLARDALLLLGWLTLPLAPEDVSQVLRSLYFDLGLSSEQAGYLDVRVLRSGKRIRPEWSLAALSHGVRSNSPRLQHRLQVLHERARALRGRRSHVEWVDEVQQILDLAGWPGSRERGSLEYQAVDRWHDLLDQISSIDTVAPPSSWSDFLQAVRHLAATTLFSPENTGAPIQVMSASESAGSTPDVLWFACANEAQWNASRSTSPMLSYAVQQEFAMPGTDAGRDAAEAFAVTERLVRSSGSVTFSYAAADESGPLRPSALVARLPDIFLENAVPLTAHSPSVELEEISEDGRTQALPDSAVASGGVSILQHQAACAFRAFVERRLFSSELEPVDLGMEARERGSILHVALQLFWRNIKNQSQLKLHHAAGTLESELACVVDQALPPEDDEDRWTAAYLGIQRQRLLGLLRRWMDYELSRPDFEVLHTEHEVKDVLVGPLRMNVRVDRIDRVNDAGQEATVLIDYKTGEPDVKGWMGDRPGEPQLPVYATAAGIENVQAIAFATVRPGKGRLGLRAFPVKSPLLFRDGKEGSQTEFEEQLVPWRETLERLAEDFASGVADVGPKEYPATCQYCAQRMLCRLNPELLDELAVEEEAEAAH